ncbi:MAG: zinc ribbon domain-containing protein [Oscillospiraceae bacterium]|nr:zinc ribbon domain-containing protein [Oscillospiraceae bacterium]
MPSSSICEYCGSTLRSDQQFCPNCGAANPGYVPEKSAGKKAGGRPQTIGELQEFCAERGMPLQKMRFFIGTDERSPRAFGIYKDGNDYVVYKNKSDGSRAERYRGPDEAFAVKELFDKLIEEHAKRAAQPQQTRARTGGGGGGRPPQRKIPIRLIIAAAVVLIALSQITKNSKNGYYRFSDDLFYRYGSSWFVDDGYGGWRETDGFPVSDYDEYYEGGSYDESWGSSDFSDSEYWDDIDSYDDSDSDWDSDWDDWDYGDWDYSGSDWDSDW